MTDTTSSPHTVSRLTVRVRGARLAFGGRTLFDGLDFDVAGGQWTCVLGPSGVGKTSLLRLIAGLTSPKTGSETEGTVSTDDGNPVFHRVAYMAQQDLLAPWLSTLDNVLLGSRLRGEPPDRDRAHALLEKVGLGANMSDLPAALSGGMRQRAALARTLMEDRPIVLMDEPFSALDAITRVRLQDLAAENLSGKTVLLVTHDPLEALRLGHRIYVLAARPATFDRVIEPTGAPPRNLHDSTVLGEQGDLLDQLARADTEGLVS